MEHNAGDLLPGSRTCVGCGGLTFRHRADTLCPRCAFEAESLIERIELDCLDRDLQLMTEFEAYYRTREQQRERLERVAKRPVFRGMQPIDANARMPEPFEPDPFWLGLRRAG